mgnify:CR=1 FL=1
MLTRTQAIQQLSSMVQSTEYPELNSDELGTLIDTYKRSNDWAASTLYVYGDVVQPVVKNGRLYECVQTGTSGATNVFPDYYTYGATGIGFVDNTVMWVDAGTANVEIYDVRQAARAGWILKAAKVANLISSKDGSQDINLEALQKQFLVMSEKYRPVVIY